MKTVWREQEFPVGEDEMPLIWTMPASGNGEKAYGKHPTQKPVALVERCILASTQPGDLVLDPFLGGGTNIGMAFQIVRMRATAAPTRQPSGDS